MNIGSITAVIGTPMTNGSIMATLEADDDKQ